MSNYTQSTFFTPKDSLTPGDPLKIIKGSDVDPELSAISTAIGTKVDTAGTGIAIASTTVSLDFSALTDVAPVAADEFVFGDVSDSDNVRRATFAVIEAALNHDSLTGFVADEHVAHTGVDIGTASDSGLTGGGDISSTRALSVDILNTTLHGGIDGAADLVLIWDTSVGALRRAPIDDALSAGTGYVPSSRDIVAGAGMTGGGDLSADRTLNVIGGDGITVNANDLEVDINGLTGAVAVGADSIMIYDASAGGLRKETLTDIKTLVEPSSASTSAEGIIELATQTEVNTGTDATRAVTPSTLANYTGIGNTGFEIIGLKNYDFTNVGTAQTFATFALDASKYYMVEGEMRVTSTTGGYLVQMDPPAADSIHVGTVWGDGSSSGTLTNSTGGVDTLYTETAGSSRDGTFRFHYYLEPSSSGNVIFTVHQDSADANTSQIHAGYIRVTEIAVTP